MKQKIEEIVRKNFKKTFRQDQFNVVVEILSALFIEDFQHVILDAPTGSGKSNIAAMIAACSPSVDRLINKPEENPKKSFKTNIITSTKNLQEQYLNDYNLVDLKGKMNYPCQFDTYYDSGDCFIRVQNKDCNKKIECDYYIQRNIWLNSSERLTNYSFMIEACDTITQHSNNKASLMILDECHLFGEKIQNHCSIEFDIRNVEGYLKYLHSKTVQFIRWVFKRIIEIIHQNTKNDVYICEDDDIIKELKSFSKEFEGCRNILSNQRNSIDLKKVENRKLVRHLSDAINIFGEYSDRIQILTKKGVPFLIDGNKLRPILPSSMADFALYRKADKFVHMSATICNPKSYADEIGIDRYKYVKMENEIPVENRIVYVNPVQLVKNNPLDRHMMAAISEIIDINKGNNGIIHTVSFDRAKEIQDNLKSKRFFISNKSEEIENEFKKGEGKILLSPSVIEGYDFKDDLSRFQIFVKIPYLSVADKLNSHMFEANKALYFRRAILKIVQGCGRSIRHKDDWALTYILDSGFNTLYHYNNEIFPEWFRESVEFIK